MKKFSLLALAAAGLLLGACSSNDEVNDQQGPEKVLDGAYVGISIQLPNMASPMTRANEDFQDGDNNEWAVKNATLYIFKGANEADATYVGSYAMTTAPELDTPANNNVEATINKATLIDGKVADEIKNSAAGINYYAYVIVNNNGQVAPLDASVKFSDFSKREFNSIGADIAAEANIRSGGLLMTNAPVSAAAGGSAAAPTTASNYTTLAKLIKGNIFATESEALAAPAACVYVERAAVKISVKKAETLTDLTVGAVPYVFDGWQIINYEPTYYNNRQIEASWGDYCTQLTDAEAAELFDKTYNTVKSTNKYRFVSYAALQPSIPTGHAAGPFRTYFGKDVNYNNGVALSKPVAGETWIEFNKNGYTTENTFDVEHQTWHNTTMVTFRVKFNGGAPFYMITGDDAIYKSADKNYSVEAQKADYLTGTTAAAKAKLEEYINSLPAVQNALVAAINKYAPASTTWEGKVEVTLPVLSDASLPGPHTVTSSVVFTLKSGSGSLTYENIVDETGDEGVKYKTNLDNAITAALNAYKANYYVGGYSYYNVRIQHFGEWETPWSASKPFQTIAPGTTVAQIYGATSDANYEKNFLGRYGVVRDNWYQLEIEGVNKIGSAVPVSVTGNPTPDDEIENYISVHVHMLPWVIRKQSVILK